jgi:hypothetical protein
MKSAADHKRSADQAAAGGQQQPAPKKPRAPAAPRPKKEKPPTAEQLRRAIGDVVKSKIEFTKYTIAARTQCTVDMDARTFELLIKPNASRITPDPNASGADLSSAPVVVARLTGGSIGEAFGRTKVTGGSRLGTFTANKCEVIWYPARGTADIWWTMSGWYNGVRTAVGARGGLKRSYSARRGPPDRAVFDGCA